MGQITVQELEEKRKLCPNDIVVIDVREKWEYNERNIGARNIPLCELPRHLTELKDHKEIILHCRSGRRSNQGRKYLIQQGIKAYSIDETVSSLLD